MQASVSGLSRTRHPAWQFDAVHFSVCRPLLPAMCRKRPLCQGQALRAACADLDTRGRASGIKYSRAMGGDGSAGGSGQGHSIDSKRQRQEGKKTKDILAPTPTDGFISPIGYSKNADRMISFTCQPVSRYRTANFPHGRPIPSYRRNHARRIPSCCVSRKPRLSISR